MFIFRSAIGYATLFSALLSTLSCGVSLPRHLVSVSVTPATASAHNSPNGQVQFSAVGTFDRAPSPTTLSPATWIISPTPNPSDAASINENGVAQCKAGFVGTVTVEGGQAQCGPTSTDACKLIHGSAQLTCP
jgi:hypothetical protein